MKNIITFLSIIGLVSMSQLAVAQSSFPVADGDVLTADMLNELAERITALEADNALVPGPPEPTIEVGQTGPGGGWIFYVTADGQRGLEVTKTELAAGVEVLWGCDGTEVGAFGAVLGAGRRNTSEIITRGCTSGTDAADIANAYVANSFDDWYLPSSGELSEMYDAIGPGNGNLGNFLPEAYWSSTEDEEIASTNALSLQFANGNVLTRPKNSLRYVRAVRIFDISP